jgi:hypothetical protein
MRASKKRPRERTGNGMVRPHIGERCWDGASVERSTAMSNNQSQGLPPAQTFSRVRVASQCSQAKESGWRQTVRVLTIMGASK